MSRESNRINETFDENGNPIYVVKNRHGDKVIRVMTKKDKIVFGIMTILVLCAIGFMSFAPVDPKIKVLVFVPVMVVLVIFINRSAGLKHK